MNEYGLLTTKQAAEILGIKSEAVVAAINKNRIPAIKFAGVWMIVKEEVDRYERQKPGPKTNIKKKAKCIK